MREDDLDECADASDDVDDIDPTLIDWFLTLSPSERLQGSANWARLAGLGRGAGEDEGE
jgi:hypothetical protein